MRKIQQLNINIRNESNDVAVIDIDGVIGFDIMKFFDGEKQENTKEAIKQKLKEISAIKAKKIIVNISSPGGFVDDGLAIHDALAQHEAEIETRVTGMTASAATVIAQAGDKRLMSDNALYLIHQAWGFAIGNTHQLSEAIEDLTAIDKRILNIYTKRSGKSEDEIKALFSHNNGAGKWIDADEAKELGLIDDSFEPMKAAASVDMNVFKNLGLPMPDSEKYQFVDISAKDESEKAMVIKIDGTDFFNKLDERMKKENESQDSEETPQGVDLYALAREREVELLIN